MLRRDFVPPKHFCSVNKSGRFEEAAGKNTNDEKK